MHPNALLEPSMVYRWLCPDPLKHLVLDCSVPAYWPDIQTNLEEAVSIQPVQEEKLAGLVLLVNTVTADNAEVLLKTVWQRIQPWGRLALIFGVHHAKTPSDFPRSFCLVPEQVEAWAKQVGFKRMNQIRLAPCFVGLMLQKVGYF